MGIKVFFRISVGSPPRQIIPKTFEERGEREKRKLTQLKNIQETRNERQKEYDDGESLF